MTSTSSRAITAIQTLHTMHKQSSGQSRSACRERDEFHGQRIVDLILSAGGIILLSPVIVLRATMSLLFTGRVFKVAEPEEPGTTASKDSLTPAHFNGKFPGSGLATLFSVFKGSHTLAGSSPSAKRPGIFSAQRLRQGLGVEYLQPESQHATPSGWSLRDYFELLGKSVLAKFASPVRELEGGRDFHVFGIRILNSTMPCVLDGIEETLATGRQTTIAFVNADCLNKCFSDMRYHRTLQEMHQVYPDGIGVRLAAQMFGNGVEDNINGTDLFPQLCARLAAGSCGIFLLGARAGVARVAADNMLSRYPGLVISGCHHGYFSADEEGDVIRKINKSGAAVVLVAFGAPRQEIWLSENHGRLQASVLIGVGGLFDFYSGAVKRAPVWLREVGLEWAWRLLQEPGRMWRRYVIGNPLFLYRVWRQKRNNGAIARSMKITPTEEAQMIKYFGNLDHAAALRHRLIRARQAYWNWLRAGAVVLKRMVDIIAASLLLVLLAPLFLLVIVLIRIESPGPAFFSQIRVGERGSLFRLWKFRSMYIDAEKQRAELDATNEMPGGVIFKIKRDPRITRLGCFIRKLSIDELPQLWNVLTGDMSLVGPRPALESEVERYSIRARVRLLAKPGLTCIWQVSGRSDIPFSEQVVLDEDYLYCQSLATDLKLLLQTIPAVLGGKGAY